VALEAELMRSRGCPAVPTLADVTWPEAPDTARYRDL
jgi:hypothetical protein